MAQNMFHIYISIGCLLLDFIIMVGIHQIGLAGRQYRELDHARLTQSRIFPVLSKFSG